MRHAKSTMSKKTSMRGGGWAIMPVDVDTRVGGARRRTGQAPPHLAHHACTRLRLAWPTLSETCRVLPAARALR